MEDNASGQSLKDEGLRLFQEGLYEEAAARFRQAQDLFLVEGNAVDAAEMVNNLGVVHRMQGNWDEAIAALEEAKASFAQLGDRSREAQTIGNLGGLYASKGDREKAKECLCEAAELFGELGDTQRQGETLLALGVQSWKTGDRSEGIATYETGLGKLANPTASQKALRGLLSLRNRLLSKRDS